MKNNRIPRNFYSITGKILIDTSETKADDIIHVTKNDCGYLGCNVRTGKYFYIFVSMLRNSEIFQIIEIMK